MNPEELFGRKELLDQLFSFANNGNAVAIIGPRRFGKTSILKCTSTLIKNDDSSKVYPIYFDFKEVGSIVSGTDNVYRYMISLFAATLFKDNHFKDEATFKKVNIKASKDWEDIYESLANVNSVRIQGVFEELVTFFSELLEKCILFLIDEYEWLFRFSFDQPVGFMKLRNFSAKITNNGVKPFSFWIAGAIPWDYLCSITGSPELNVIDAPIIYVNHIEFDAFSMMWDFEVNKLDYKGEILKNRLSEVYNASGGIPFYGKVIGSHLLTTSKDINYTILKPHFQELFNSFQTEEKVILKEIAQIPKRLKNSKFILNLIENGIVKHDNIHEIRSSLFRDFINSDTKLRTDSSTSKEPDCQVITNNIENLILSINQTHHNKKGHYIFEPVVDDSALMKDLRTPCFSIELFSDFASSLYKIVFERTKARVSGNDIVLSRLPMPFKRGHQFIDIVDIMRHSLGHGHLMGTFTQRPGQLSKAKMLEILTGSRNEPNDPQDFYKLQLSTLTMFESQLSSINIIVRAML